MRFYEALNYAAKMHEGQKRKEGSDYIIHPMAVAVMLEEMGYDMDYRLTGLFHDLLEDTAAKEEDILNFSNMKVLEAVKYLTKEKDYNMDNYINGIRSNEIATIVKLVDRINNLETSINTDEEFRKKYITETKKYYVSMAEGTKFQQRMNEALETVVRSLNKKK